MSEEFDFKKELDEIKKFLDENKFSEIDEEYNFENELDFNELDKTFDDNLDGKITITYVSSSGKELSYNYESDSGFDLYATEEIIIPAFGRALVPTGIYFDLPQDFEVQVRSKSGLAINQGLMVLNSPGTVDEGYTGEIKVIIFNTNQSEFKIEKGMKVAQSVVARCVTGRWVNFNKVDSIETKDRGNNGFGSTGI
jgi:dUTP pyrophosphatase